MSLQTELFPEPPVALAAVTADINDLEKLEQIQVGSASKPNTVLRNAKLGTVKEELELLSFYVQIVSRGEEGIVNAAGMVLKSRGPRKYETIVPPSDLKVLYTDYTSELKLRWRDLRMLASTVSSTALVR